MNPRYRLCMIIIFTLAATFLFLLNIKGSFKAFYRTEGGIAEKKTELEHYFEENLWGKSFFCDISSIVRDCFGFDIIGNFEFVRDDAGIIQRIEKKNDILVSTFVNSVFQLYSRLKLCDIPMIVVQLPDRGENFIFSETMHYYGKKNDEIFDLFRENKIDVLDLNENQEVRRLKDTGVYEFPTDAHLSTEAEFINAKVITQYLEEKYAIAFPMTDTVYDFNQYNFVGYPFRGNCVKSCGDRFVETDLFYMFYPLFETALQMSFDGITIDREGDFRTVMTNRYDELVFPIYYVTNYGQWPQPQYTYTNKSFPDAPRLLMICDSTMMRCNVFLTLNAHSVTIADPRYFNGTDYLTNLIECGNYDAVIIAGLNSLFHTSLFP